MGTSTVKTGVDALGRPSGPRRRYTIAEKRAIAEETVKPGASVALIARDHGINANLIFGWRRLYQQGFLKEETTEAPPLLPVKINTPTLVPTKRTKSASLMSKTAEGRIEIEFVGGRRLMIQGVVDRATLRFVIEALSRR